MCGKKNFFIFPFLLFFLVSCELVDTKITPEEPPPTRSVRYAVQMSSSSANSNPTITYTNSSGGNTVINSLNLDVTLEVDSGMTAFLSASCEGFYSPLTGNSSAAVELELFIGDSLIADSTIIETDNLSNVSASASVSAIID